jgi:Protein NO VEIN, C-terminal
LDSWLQAQEELPERHFRRDDRYLTKHPAILEAVPAARPTVTPLSAEIFVTPPVLTPGDGRIPEPLRRKFDPVERDHRNRSLGKAGEEFVVDVERHKLTTASRPDLARKVRWIAAEDGDGAGYDVLSFDLADRERLLEVKTTNGSARTPFFLTRNERELAAERFADWSIYRVHMFAKNPRIFTIAPPLENTVILRPDTWRASFT